MDKKNAETKRKLKNMETVKDFNDLLDRMLISDEERQILILIYQKQKTLSYIADELGLSEAMIKKKHSKLLRKVGKVIERTCL